MIDERELQHTLRVDPGPRRPNERPPMCHEAVRATQCTWGSGACHPITRTCARAAEGAADELKRPRAEGASTAAKLLAASAASMA